MSRRGSSSQLSGRRRLGEALRRLPFVTLDDELLVGEGDLDTEAVEPLLDTAIELASHVPAGQRVRLDACPDLSAGICQPLDAQDLDVVTDGRAELRIGADL